MQMVFVQACVWACACACLCTPLASFPPGHHMQSSEPKLAPSVGLMLSLGPKQLAPTSIIILVGTRTYTHTHRYEWRKTDRQTHSMKPRIIMQWQTPRNPGRCFWNSFWLSEQVSDECCQHEFITLSGQQVGWVSYSSVERTGEE